MTPARPLSLCLHGLAAGLIACTSIIGVEDVEKRKNTTNVRPDGGDVDDIPPDGTPDDPDGGDEPTRQFGQVAVGYFHGCGRKTSGSVVCWGDNGAGQLGDGLAFDDTSRLAKTPTPQPVPGIDDATAIAAGSGSFTCVVRKTGRVSCWGVNIFGQLGNDSTQRSSSPVDAVGLNDATRIAVGISFTCAVREGKTVMCWGIGQKGQLGQGDGDLEEHHVPIVVPGLTGVEGIACGQQHACAITSDGVKCWGDNEKGQVGAAGMDPIATPTTVAGLSDIAQLSAGATHSCARESSGKVLCWGNNDAGQLGQGSTTPFMSETPLAVLGITDATSIWSGENHTCAVRTGGIVSCWGAGDMNQIGAPPAKPVFTMPAEVANLAGAIGIWAGGNGSCAMVEDGKVSCWGANTFGQLGNGNFDPATSPRPLLDFP